MKYQTTRKLWMLLLTAALLALLFLPAALAEETLPSVHVTLGDGEPIGYFDGFEGNFLKSADSVKGVTGRLSLSYEVEGYITQNGQRKMRVDLENVTLTDDVMVLYYRLSQDEPIQYEADLDFLRTWGMPEPMFQRRSTGRWGVQDVLYQEGHPIDDKSLYCLYAVSLAEPIQDGEELIFGAQWDQSSMQYAGGTVVTIDRSHDVSLAIQDAMEEGHSEARVERGGRIWQFDVSRIGAAVGAVLLAFDITERETAEQTRREFTANVSHELKTPLQGIIGSAELLENGMVKQEDVPRFIGHIRKEAQRLVTLIGDIIRLSQLDEGDVMPRETVDLLQLTQEAADDLKTAAAEKNVSVTVEGKMVCLDGVRRLLYEVIYNLCDNAIKYNVEGGSVKMTVGEQDGKAVVSVSDTGIGIAPEHQERIFERFYRVDKSHSKASGGTGLGLSIVKHAVQYLGGRIELESQPGKGTTMRVHFPDGNV